MYLLPEKLRKRTFRRGKNAFFMIAGTAFILGTLTFCSNASSKEDTPAVQGVKIVEKYGQLCVSGNRILDQNGDPLVLRGMSLFWSQWMGKYYNTDCIRWLYEDWKCTVVRAALGIEHEGYMENPELETKKIRTVIDACISLGIYVIVDWHDHRAHEHEASAIAFFTEIARLYGDKPNLIYEIYNEPEKVSWETVVRPYAERIVQCIRSIDPDNLILVGTPTWSQDVDQAAEKPITFCNVAYTLHFYAASHKQDLRNKAAAAMEKGAALFVSEFGTCAHTGSGAIDQEELGSWFQFMDENRISWCNWSIADKNETSAVLKGGASEKGGWAETDLTPSGVLIRRNVRTFNNSLFTVRLK